MYSEQYKSIDKGNKRSSKETKKPYNNYHLQQIDSYNQWREPIQKSRSFLIRAPYVTISFNDTGFCSMLATILPSCKTISNFTNNKSINGILAQYTVYHNINNNNNPGFPDLRKCHRQILKTKAYQSTHGPITTMFRASASNHRQHKHPSCRPCYRHVLYQYAFALKSSEL